MRIILQSTFFTPLVAFCFYVTFYTVVRVGGGNMGTEQRSLVHSAFVLDKRTGILSCKTANVAS